MQIMAEICQNRPAGKDEFFRRPCVAQIEKCSTNKSEITTWGRSTKIHASKGRTEILHEFLR